MIGPVAESHERPSVRITTGSRLHFGLFDVKAPFGGLGLMVDRPRTTVVIDAATAFEIHPCQVDRVTEIAARIARRLAPDLQTSGLPRCKVSIESAADSHCGLGSGTQLALASAQAMNEFFRIDLPRRELVQEIASRGRRSSIGSIGFFEGGLIAENGREHSYEDDSAWIRCVLPNYWRVVLASPRADAAGVSGEAEGVAFAGLAPASDEHRAELVRLSDEILRLGEAADFQGLSQFIATFNVLSGQLFATHQGGCFNGPAVQALVARIKSSGIAGVGQSSWGPTVFALCENDDCASRLCDSLEGFDRRVVKPLASGYSLARSPSTSCK